MYTDSNRDLERELEGPVRRQVVAGPRLEPATGREMFHGTLPCMFSRVRFLRGARVEPCGTAGENVVVTETRVRSRWGHHG